MNVSGEIGPLHDAEKVRNHLNNPRRWPPWPGFFNKPSASLQDSQRPETAGPGAEREESLTIRQ